MPSDQYAFLAWRSVNFSVYEAIFSCPAGYDRCRKVRRYREQIKKRAERNPLRGIKELFVLFLREKRSALKAGCWLLVAGCWLLVAGCWLLVAEDCEKRV